MPARTTVSAPAGPPPPHSAARRTVLVSTVSSDAHTWNLVFLQIVIEELGHEVINLGSCVPDELLLAACRRHRPDLVVLSSVNGHGHLDGRRLITRLRREADLAALPVVIGGKLGVGTENPDELAGALLKAGFDAVFTEESPIEDFRHYLTAAQPLPGRRPGKGQVSR